MSASTPLTDTALGINNGDLYAASQGSLYLCPINADTTVTSCQTTAAGSNPKGLAFLGGTAYIANGSSTILSCAVNASGAFANCVASNDPSFNDTSGVALRQ
jgi:hypothetical protein